MKYFWIYGILLFLELGINACSKSSGDGDAKPADPEENPEIVEAVPISINFPEANFTNPDSIYNKSKASYAILNRFVQLLNATPKGDSVFISIYLLNHDRVIKALQNAGNRGVLLHLLVDSSRSESVADNIAAYSTLAKLKNTDYSVVRSSLMVSADEHAIDHNKFAVFSSVLTPVGKKNYVVFQTSNNMTEIQCTYFQDNVIVQNEGLYDAFRLLWHDIRKYAKANMDKYTYREFDDPTAGLHGYYFPKIKNGTYFDPDPVVDLLNQITDPSKTAVRIMMFNWSAARVTIVNKLASLLDQGAIVQVMVNADNPETILGPIRDLANKGAFIRIFPIKSGSIVKNIHSKHMLIDGVMNGKSASVIATGSENYTIGALKQNNETLLTVWNSPLFTPYVNNYNAIKNL
ncbi:Phosphatidylserine/phosphatidylglycerophosphate/cardiolipin synthase [bacterium A37T11]|nr:Phosphatidylserine/phosphatidylglycerophosphate/cardiolipin synthase [bacterium A37T11]